MDPEKPFGLSVRAVIFDKDGRCLLLKRSLKSKNYPGKWEFPGGKVDKDERFDAALIREVDEETTLEGSLLRFIGAASAEQPTIIVIQIIMEVRVSPGCPTVSDEHEAFTWASPLEMLEMPLVDWLLPFVRLHLHNFRGAN